MNTQEFASRYLYPYKVKGNEIVPHLCPYCNGGSKHDKETFALNISKQTFNCKRGSCGKSGTFWQLCKDFGEEADKMDYETYAPKRVYKKPETKVIEPTTQAEQYLNLRKISKETLKLLQVGCDEKGNIVFPYFENGEIVMMKFRPSKKVEKGTMKAWREEGGKPILWGMDLCNSELPLIITEGEIDTLSCYEAGLKNIVSVPSGAEDFTWLELCWEWLRQFKKIILFGDSDEPGKAMINKLKQKLNDYELYTVNNPYKDANELLYHNGKEAVKKAVDEAVKVPVYGLIDLADVQSIDMSTVEKVKSNISYLDKKIGGFLMGELSVWTGKRGQGKSTFLGQMMLEAIDQNKKVCAYSGELRADRFQYWINLQAAGRLNIEQRTSKEGAIYSYLDSKIVEEIKEWYRGKFFLYDNKISRERTEETKVIEIFKHAAKKYDCKIFLVDNLMTAKFDTSDDKNYYRMQSNFVGELVEFAEDYNVHVHLVAHPRKTNNDVGNDDVFGSGDITNLAHNVFSIGRNKDSTLMCDSVLKIMKNRETGAEETIGLSYCEISKRLYLPSIGDIKKFGWEVNKPKQWYEIAQESIECPF